MSNTYLVSVVTYKAVFAKQYLRSQDNHPIALEANSSSTCNTKVHTAQVAIRLGT